MRGSAGICRALRTSEQSGNRAAQAAHTRERSSPRARAPTGGGDPLPRLGPMPGSQHNVPLKHPPHSWKWVPFWLHLHLL